MDNQKALRDEYKQKKFRIGVFQLRNLDNQKILIGSNVNLDAIWNRIRSELNLGGFRNPPLQEDWKNLGQSRFVFEVLVEIQQVDTEQRDYAREVRELEKLYIDELQPFGERGYNVKK
ncbi:GIY-YIG nuclease family protein [Dyadobacter diqingensis]|uniref:GIY-YIG nuclease family protein n=1 Tax=Dyadobacter diqingensis TaxID=2938121 RepID=UPI0020C4F07A|nr:GIY-YIG nuclease family protein [Dyadobacter diqingensis]